jgi:dihydrofolate synthase/folylpolyglutamate synthase
MDGPYAALLPDGWELWLDGGHNPGAAAVLAAHVARWSDRPLHLVIGMLNTRDPAAFLGPLAPFVARLRTVAIRGERNTWTAAETASAARRIGMDAEPADDLRAALRDIVRAQRGPARVMICGSLYLAGTVLAGSA